MKQEGNFIVTVAKVDSLLFSGEALSVTLPGTDGELTILPNHEPFITTLKSGTITIRTKDEEMKIVVEKGFAETSSKQLTVLV